MKYSGFIGNIQDLLVLLPVETDVHCTKTAQKINELT